MISIHSPRTGRDVMATDATLPTSVFQSTLPTEGETCKDALLAIIISIHSPRAGRDAKKMDSKAFPNIDFNPLSQCGERLLDSEFDGKL